MPKYNLAIGLPGAGKTSFLAALWDVVDKKEVPGALILDKLQDERGYVQQIRTSWVGLQDVGRTQAGSISPITMSLKVSATSPAEAITFPDLSGEAYDTQLTDRELRADFAALARDASGVILFIHPATNTPGTRIEVVEKVLAGIPTASTPAVDQPTGSWDTSKIPTQAKLVELLQFLDVTAETDYPISVVISAWDVVIKANKGKRQAPATWLNADMPLLSQYLIAHNQRHRHKVFGVSAVGGDLKDDIDRLKKQKPFQRILVDAGDGKPNNDITLPIKWLISEQ